MGSLIEMFFSFEGRIGRKVWWIGILAVSAAGLLGAVLLNGDSYDESANAVRGAPTMGMFLWAMLCILSATSLNIKRLKDSDWPAWLGVLAGLGAAALLIGWGLGFFLDPIGGSPAEVAILWTIALGVLLVLIACGFRRGSPGANRHGQAPSSASRA